MLEENRVTGGPPVFTVPIRKTRFFPAHFTKSPVAPMISKIRKQYVPHLEDLKLGFRF